MRRIVAGKLHCIHVTDANIDYHGSVTLDPDHCEQAGILPMEFVEIWNKNSGARLTTYVILGARGSRCCILNGAAARTCQRGDPVIICNSIYLDEARITEIRPRVLTFDRCNRVKEVLAYSVERDQDGRYAFSTLGNMGERLAISGNEAALPAPAGTVTSNDRVSRQPA